MLRKFDPIWFIVIFIRFIIISFCYYFGTLLYWIFVALLYPISKWLHCKLLILYYDISRFVESYKFVIFLVFIIYILKYLINYLNESK